MTIICFVLLLAAEIFADIGVYESPHCHPQKKKGEVILRGQVSSNVTYAELTASAFHLQNVQFVDGELTSIPSSFPRNIASSTCIPCLTQWQPTLEPILADCTVREGRKYAAGNMSISVLATGNGYGINTTMFEHAATATPKQYGGQEDLFRAGSHCPMFILQTDMRSDENAAGITFTLIEYSNNTHCAQLLRLARSAKLSDKGYRTVTRVTKGVVHSYSIRCNKNQLSVANFTLALQVYRTMQLQGLGKLGKFSTTESGVPAIRVPDVYRAVLAMKVIVDKGRNGTFYEYRGCGKYHGVYAIPFVICILSLALLSAVAFFKSRHVPVHLPHSSYEWYQQLTASSRRVERAQYVGARSYITHEGIRSSPWWFRRPLDEVVITWDVENQSARLLYVNREAAVLANAEVDGAEDSWDRLE